MKGQEILQGHIGHRLTGGLIQSFELNKELSDLINVTFLKFEDQWTHIVTTDEMTTIRLEHNSIETTEFFGDEEFKYPIRPIASVFPDFNQYMGKKLLGFKELVLKDYETMSFGINFYFEDNLNFIIYNHDYPIDKNEYFFKTVSFDDIKEI